MWDKFAPKPDGIAIRTRVEKIRSALSAWNRRRYLCIRKIEYTEDHDAAFPKFGCPFLPFSIKREKEFANENELRIIYGEGKGCIEGSTLYFAPEIDQEWVRIPIDPSTLIEEIVLSPASTTRAVDKVKKVSNNNGLHVPIVPSFLSP
jgi:hypothetical protein